MCLINNKERSKTMSDGNFNRALLPSTPYRSGLKMGKQIMHKQAKDAFSAVMDRHFPNVDAETRQRIEEDFQKAISEALARQA